MNELAGYRQALLNVLELLQDIKCHNSNTKEYRIKPNEISVAVQSMLEQRQQFIKYNKYRFVFNKDKKFIGLKHELNQNKIDE